MTTLKQAAQMYGLPKINLTQGKQATVDVFNLKKFTLTAPCILKPTNTPITANKILKVATIP